MRPDAAVTPSASCSSKTARTGLGFGQFVRARDLSAYQVRSGLGALKDEAAGRR
jgi:hypothetical protein